MKLEHGLVSPLAEARDALYFAPRPGTHESISVLLIDGMLNPKSGWGQSLLDGVEDVVSGFGRSFRRIARQPGGASFPEGWARTHIGKAHLAITAVGD